MLRVPFVLFLTIAAVASACDGDGGGLEGTPPSGEVSPSAETTLPPPTATIVATTATVRLLQPAGEISVGSTFTVIVRIIGATNLGAYQLSPSYDGAVLDLLEIRGGDLLDSTGRTPTCLLIGEDPSVLFLCATSGLKLPGPSGDGDLALLEFRALAPGETVVGMEEIVVTMPDARDIPTIVEPVTVTVAP